MKTDWTTIHYTMLKLNGNLIRFTTGNFESMIMHYRKLRRANKINRVEKDSLRYDFGKSTS